MIALSAADYTALFWSLLTGCKTRKERKNRGDKRDLVSIIILYASLCCCPGIGN